ncbi:MAG: sulfite exporter TauE/SafE family protein [Candidatus Hydrothermarchaeota archaeon]|nr:sulfite exporter TauE/SafE family protein [Candidatus Hydrothermarchaeota archaeon]
MAIFPISGAEINLLFPILLGFTVGIVGGFIGVGGGYMVTPALIIFGVPGNLAVGTDITHIAGKSVIATIRHRQLGNVDIRLGLIMVVSTMLGVEMGVQLINYFKARGLVDVVVLTASLILLFGIGVYTQVEAKKSKKILDQMKKDGKKLPRDVMTSSFAGRIQRLEIPPMIHLETSRLRISFWIIFLVGFATGALAGFFGVGGGFIRVPALIYLVGTPTLVAVGTDLFEIIISAGYGSLRHGMSGNVDIMIALTMLLGATLGAQIGAIATSYVSGPSVRFVLSWSVLLALFGAALNLGYVLTERAIPILGLASKVVILVQMFILVGMIIGLVIVASLARRGYKVPEFLESMIVK